MAARSMTSGEITLAKTVYKNEIDYTLVKIYNEKWFAFQPNDRAMAPQGNIHYAPGDSAYCSDFSITLDIHKKATFIHELAHVWQYQKDVWVVARGIFERDYDYLPLTTSSNFDDYGIEEQAQIIRDYFYLLNGYSNTSWPAISVYIHVIPFLP